MDILEDQPDAKALIERGLLPENLPPVFNSRQLSGPLSVTASRTYAVTKRRTGKLAPYNSSKRGDQRRLFSIPHPLFHRDASLFFQKNWSSIRTVIDRSTGSASKPKFPMSGFRAVEITPQTELPTIRLKTLARKKFCLVTDVSRCFPSIYTHSIPWALDGKERAKQDHREDSTSVRGNRLDFILRQSQDRQTIGIPVGPDTSRLISELILSRVDADFLQSERRKVYFVRHVDDYWIGGETAGECEEHLRRLRLGLAEYQLDINELKTRVIPLSDAFGETWPTDLKNEIRMAFPVFGSRSRQHDITALFSKVVSLAARSRDDGIIKYTIRQMDRASAWRRSWDILEPFLAHCAIQFPHSLDYVARVVAWRVRLGQQCDRELWREVARSAAARAAGLGHDSELLWALWLLKELSAKLTARQCELYSKISGPMVLGFLAHMSARGLAPRALLTSLEALAVGDEQFSGVRWPLSLELYHLDHCAKLQAHRKAEGVTVSAFHADRVSLIDWDVRPRVFDSDDGGGGPEGGEPEYAIEDFASAYDDDEDGSSDVDDDDSPF